jgi:hypothetical protein
MPAPTPIEQLIVDKIVERLQAIEAGNVYHTDAGDHVIEDFDPQSPPADWDDAPVVLSVIDPAVTPRDGSTPSRRKARMNIIVSAYVPIDKETGQARARARLALADVRRAIRADLRCPTDFLAGVTQMSFGDSRMPIEPDGSKYLIASQDVAVDFHETFND